MSLTAPFLTDQLIPYIGNKRKLLPMIQAAIQSTGLSEGTFCDFFAGSGVVSRLAKSMGYRVIANDWEPYSHIINRAYMEANSAPDFSKIGGMQAVFDRLNSLSPVKGYIATHYCPEDDENPDFERERMFYTQENGRRIDAIREQIEDWLKAESIDRVEEAVLLAPLVYQASYCSNTSGVFKAFHRGWGGATKTAWYRIRSKLTLTPPLFFNNGRDNLSLREDAVELASKLKCNIAYIDPPYNQHQYGSNYHLLNTVALWDKPQISPHIDPGTGPRNKSAIRMDWRTERKSNYCYSATAFQAFSDLLARICSDYVLVSYSTDGLIPLDAMLDVLAAKGRLSVLTHRYKRYRVSSQRPSLESHNIEFVAIVDTSVPSTKDDANLVRKIIHDAENDPA